MGFCLILIGVIIHSCSATGNIYALDSVAIYDGLFMPENIIGTNLQVKIVVNIECFDNFQFSESRQFCGLSGWVGLACPPLATTGKGMCIHYIWMDGSIL